MGAFVISIPKRKRRRRRRPRGLEWLRLLAFFYLIVSAVGSALSGDAFFALFAAVGSGGYWIDVPLLGIMSSRGARTILHDWLIGEEVE